MAPLRARLVVRWGLVLLLGGAVLLCLQPNDSRPLDRSSSDQDIDRFHDHRTGDQEIDRFQKWEVEPNSTWMSAAATRMHARRQHLRKACTFFGLDAAGNDSLHRANPWEFLLDRKHHLVWCNVFKAASSSWMYNFNLLAGYSPDFLAHSKQVPLMLARKHYPRPSLQELQEAVNDSVSFLIVRHPFERLVSAYREKIEGSLRNSPHRRLGAEIVKKYRNVEKSTGPPTFAEFVAYLLDSWRRGEAFDMHWTPVTTFCSPCQVAFDVVAKFETFEDDQRYLIAVAGLQNLIRPQWRNPTKGSATSELATAHFAQLTRAQILELYDIYRYDFELFGYTLDGFLGVVWAPMVPAETSPTRLDDAALFAQAT